MRCFLLCLGPAILGFVILGLGLAMDFSEDVIITIPMLLFGIGALISGSFVANKTFHKITSPEWWKSIAAVLTFLGVTVAYFAATMGGCCAIAVG